MTYDSNLVSDDESEQELLSNNNEDDDQEDLPSQREQPLVTNFDLNGPKDLTSPTVIEDEED
jgi:hypothetical protein